MVGDSIILLNIEGGIFSSIILSLTMKSGLIRGMASLDWGIFSSIILSPTKIFPLKRGHPSYKTTFHGRR
jgi:hypothetical protein